MSNFIPPNTIVAISAAVLAAAVIAGLPPVSSVFAPEAKAETLSDPRLAKADRLAAFIGGAACSSRSWPNYDQACQFDLRRSADDIRKVRVLALERDASPSLSLE